MSHGTRAPKVSTDPASLFTARVHEWLHDYAPLLEALGILRQLDGEAEAVDALLAARPVARLRLSWELWEALASGDGTEPDELLRRHLGEDTYGLIRYMVWGITDSCHVELPW